MILMRVESEELLRNHLEERSAHSMARHHRFTGRREGNCLGHTRAHRSRATLEHGNPVLRGLNPEFLPVRL